VANRTAATGNIVSMVSASPELLFGGERWLSNIVVFGLAALLSSDAAMLVGLATPSRFGAASSDGSVLPLSTFFRIRGGDLRVFFFSTVTEESRVWVISGLGFIPPAFAALGGMIVIVLMCGLGVVHVVVVVVIVDVRGMLRSDAIWRGSQLANFR
jgi:hypothetical protein